MSNVVHFEIPASDVRRLSKFYRDCFGWKFKKQDMGGFEYWLITTGTEKKGELSGGGIYQKGSPEERTRNYVQVAVMDGAIKRLQKAGGTIVMPKQKVPNIGFTAVGLDPEGNPVGLFQPVPAPKSPRRRTGN